MAVEQSTKQIVQSILAFLSDEKILTQVSESDRDSLGVSRECIAEAFGVQVDDKATSSASLVDMFSKMQPTGASNKPASSTTASEEDIAKAEALKGEGNSLMSAKNYAGAIEKYTQALKLNSKSTVYLSNRAAAHSSNGQFDKAEQDAQAAIDIDPSFARAYSRLGHALYSQNKFSEAVKAYEAGLEREPGNAAMKSSLETARSRLSEDSTVERSGSPSAQGAGPAGGMPDLSALAGMFGGAGAPGGAGGMPDLASMMNNPAMMQMAQQFMANGGMERMMSNPSIRSMAERMQNGGGAPDINSLMSDPAMQDMARNMMGGKR